MSDGRERMHIILNDYRKGLIDAAKKETGQATSTRAVFNVLEQYFMYPNKYESVIESTEAMFKLAKEQRKAEINEMKKLRSYCNRLSAKIDQCVADMTNRANDQIKDLE